MNRRLIIKNYLRGPYAIGSEKITEPPPPENKWLPGDLINAEGKTVERSLVPLRRIHGVLDLLNRTGQGFSPRGVPLFLFYPLDQSLPPFLVSYKDHSPTNLLVSIQYEHWSSGRWPRGGIVAVHGPVGNANLERKLLCETYNVSAGATIDSDVPFPACVRDHESLLWDHAFNIDPEGTEDVDDIFAWRRVDEATYFMIAIADVAAWVPAGCGVDIRAQELGQTLYDNGEVMTPMLPASLSTRTASLRHDGVARPVLGLVFEIRDGAVAKVSWHKYLVTLTSAFTYESILKNLDIATELYDLLRVVCNVRPDPLDTHDWVAQAMITYNHTAARFLSSVGLGVLRRHDGIPHSDYSVAAEKSGIADLRNLGSSAGTYAIGSSLQTNHAGLGLEVYCHASSPLRRYADLLNQRTIKYLLFGDMTHGNYGEEVIEHLNARSRIAKIVERELLFLSLIKSDRINTVEGICLKQKDSLEGHFSVYVPAWKRKITGCGPTHLGAGDRVSVRTFCDLRRACWRERIVCQLAPLTSCDTSACADV
jgi:exoribonuclease R